MTPDQFARFISAAFAPSRFALGSALILLREVGK